MDRYSFRENMIYIESECRYLPQHENLDLLNTLTRELADCRKWHDEYQRQVKSLSHEEYEKAQRELIALKQQLADERNKSASLEVAIKKVSDLNSRVEHQLAAAEAKIRKAPHARDCNILIENQMFGNNHWPKARCNCWKAEE